MRTILTSLAILLPLVSGCTEQTPAAPPPPLEPVATVKQLMQAIVIPTSDTVWSVAGEAPDTEEEWLAVTNAALALAESGNLLMIGERAVDTEQWRAESLAMIAAAKDAAAAAQAHDVDRLLEAGDAIYVVCERCHMQYMIQQ